MKWLKRINDRIAERGDYGMNRAYIAGYIMGVLHHVFCILAGIAGFLGAASVALLQASGYGVAWLWSGIFVLFGTLGLVARFARRASAEGIAVLVIAVGRIIWAAVILVEIAQGRMSQGSVQIALLMASGAFFLAGWSITVFVWMSGTPLPSKRTQTYQALQHHLEQVVKHQAEDEGDKNEGE